MNALKNQTAGRLLQRSVHVVAGVLLPFTSLWAETVLVTQANIVTMNTAAPIAQAMAYRDGQIIAIGSPAEVKQAAGEIDTTIDLQGKTVVPGFIETHDHMVLGSISYALTNVEPFHTPRLADALKAIGMAKPNADGWVVAFGADQTMYEERRGPSRDELDQLHPDNPVIVLHLSGHGGFANSAALRAAGVDESTPDPAGGYFERDDNGRLTGYLSGQPALFKVFRYPAPNAESLQLAAQARLAAGVTTASEMGFMDKRLLELAREVTSREDFPLRLMGALTINTPDFDTVAADLKRYETPRMTLRFGKTWTDGSTQGGTAYLSKGYHDHTFGGAGAQASQDSFNQTLDKFYQYGLWPAVHANGDGAIDVALDAIAYAEQRHPKAEARPHLIHALYSRPEQITRMKAMGVGVTFFPTHVYYWGDLHYERTLGPERAERMSALAQAYAEGLEPTMHNDPPVTPVNPLLNMWIAVNRTSTSGRVLGAEQAISAEQALAAYTRNAALQFGMEREAGTLEVGKFADYVVLSANPLAVDKQAIRDIEVETTVVAGKQVFARQ